MTSVCDLKVQLTPLYVGYILLSAVGLYGTAIIFWKARNVRLFSKQKRLPVQSSAGVNGNARPMWLYEVAELSDDEDEDGEKNPAQDCVYLDYNGTTPVYPEVLHAMMPFLTQHFGNPSSGHVFGRVPRDAVNKARQQILRELLKSQTVESSAIWFTSCGTESDNLAIHLALQSTLKIFQKESNTLQRLPHIVTSNVEHPAVTECLNALVEQGRCEVTFVPVSPLGWVTANDIVAAIRPETVLVTLMLANNESGVLQPVKEVAEHCRKNGILFHTDAAQAAGKVSVALDDLGQPDLVSLVGHKIGAPKGIACLYVRPHCFEENGRSLQHKRQGGILLQGCSQEFGRRGGTENVASIIGMGRAAVLAARNLSDNAATMERIRNQLKDKLIEYLGEKNVRDNGPRDPSLRLPNTLSIGLRDVHSGDLLAAVGDKVAASAGATCHSACSISFVLRAMKVPEEFARGTLRLSVGPRTTAESVDRAAMIIAESAKAQLASKSR